MEEFWLDMLGREFLLSTKTREKPHAMITTVLKTDYDALKSDRDAVLAEAQELAKIVEACCGCWEEPCEAELGHSRDNALTRWRELMEKRKECGG